MPHFAVLGCGSIGRRHIANLLKLSAGSVVAYDPSEPRRKEAEQTFGIKTVNTLEACWDESPDAAFVTAPTSLHLPLALEAARHGAHLFIEKPIADRWAGLEELITSVAQRQLVSLVGCNMRFHPGLQTIHSLLENDTIGFVTAARVETGQYLPDWHPWEDYRSGYSARRELGGGIILDAIHEIDYVRWLLGEVDRVSCFADTVSHLEIETEDVAAILLRFRTGAIASLHLDYVQRAYSRGCHIIGEEGTIRWDFESGQVRWYTAESRQWQVCERPAGWDVNAMYLAELRHFLKCLSGEETPQLDAAEAAAVLRIALAAKESAGSGKAVTVLN